MERKDFMKDIKRIVVKVGTSVLKGSGSSIDPAWLSGFSKEIKELRSRRKEVLVVSSGAIAAGMHLLGVKKRPRFLPELQACAAIGQGYLMKIYEDSFKKKGFHAAQVLLTREDMRDRRRYLNAENTICTLIKQGAVPVVNENDTVSVDEIKFGDNDMLSALVANLVMADLLVMLTDVDGFYLDGSGEVARVIREISNDMLTAACGTDKECSLGGMKTKLEACRIAMRSGIPCVVVNGREKGVLKRVLAGEDIGTFFVPRGQKLQARKRWIAYNASPKGEITVDGGAREAIVNKNRSLLACGIKDIKGRFAYGDIVIVKDEKGNEIARGLVNYNSDDLMKIKGMNTGDIRKAFEGVFYEEAIHRDNMAVTL